VSMNYGWPPASDEIGEVIDKRLVDVREQDNPETVRVSFRGANRDLPVISMPIAQLYLNPNTHRVRAQRSVDTTRDAKLNQAPWSDEAQAYLESLLKAKPSDPTQPDPEYAELLDELRRDGQLAAGVVTRTGVLVDANTRCVALKELGVTDIRVAVLPLSADWRDIDQVELRIQLRRDKRRDYPYINRLISVEEQIEAGVREADVAHEWNLRPASLRADRWSFQLIKDAVERSATADGATLTLLQFNDQQESFRELHRHYTSLAASDPEAADRLKEARLAAIVLGLPKTSLRFLEGDFYSNYLRERLPERLRPEVPEATSVSIPGLPTDVMIGDDNAETRATRALTDQLLQAKADIIGNDAVKATAGAALLREADEIFRTAARRAGQDNSLQKKKSAVPDQVSEAADCLVQGAREFARSKAERTLDMDAFDESLQTLRESLEQLAKQAGRVDGDDRGAGVEWLLNAVRQG
jgi:hypothetical protein